MGCTSSKTGTSVVFHADGVDDSIHTMLQKEERLARTNGQAPSGYRPPAPHPLLQKARQIQVCEEDDKTSQGSLVSALAKAESVNGGEDVQRLLFHTKHHCDTIDRRDLNTARRNHIVAPGTC